MPTIHLETIIACSPEIVFDLSRSINLHMASTSHTKEKVIGGKAKGLIQLGESVTWEATHFGFRQKLTSKITQFQRPQSFRDSMVSGAFKKFDHDHIFEPYNNGTKMTDVFNYRSPLGLLGRIADTMFLKNYMKRLLMQRNQVIKKVAENNPELYL